MKSPVCIAIEPNLLARLDRAAQADARSRSAMAELLLRRGLDSNPAPPPAAPPPAAQEAR